MGYRSLVICPGRGSYNRPELGYIQRILQHSSCTETLFKQINAALRKQQLPGLHELDGAAHFSARLHGKAEHAASLILGAGLLDYHSLDQSQFDVVAMTGNSMGWYTALACSGVWQPDKAVTIATTMAALTNSSKRDDDCGMQLIYPLMDAKWQLVKERKQRIEQYLNQYPSEIFYSIRYGGYAVMAGSSRRILQLHEELPPIDDRFPLLLNGHAAFHSPFMQGAAERALEMFTSSDFRTPSLPLVDGTGQIWTPNCTEVERLREYTLDKQVVACFDFSIAVQVAVKEFCPERIILLGPGNALASAVIQAIIEVGWRGLSCKEDFKTQQLNDPWLLAFGDEQQSQALRSNR